MTPVIATLQTGDFSISIYRVSRERQLADDFKILIAIAFPAWGVV
jgi:hypothetical protein